MGALDGTRVIDLGLLVQGPQAAAMLGGRDASARGRRRCDDQQLQARHARCVGARLRGDGVLAALLARERTGRGQRVDVSLVGGQIWAQASEYTAFFMSGEQPGRSNYGHPIIHAVYGILPTADGWIAMIGVPPALRAAFYNTIGRPDLLDDPRFGAMLLDPDDRKALFVILAEVFRTRTSDDWLTRLKAAGQRVARCARTRRRPPTRR